MDLTNIKRKMPDNCTVWFRLYQVQTQAKIIFRVRNQDSGYTSGEELRVEGC